MSDISIVKLYEILNRLSQTQFKVVCFYLREKYGYDLSYVDLDKARRESANQLIEFIKQYRQGLNHLSEVIDEVTSQKSKVTHNPQQTKSIPKSLLFYSPDRRLHKEKLQKTIETYQTEYSDEKRPLLCLIHGNENEYGNFINCLLNETPPNDQYLFKYFRKIPLKINLSIGKTDTVDELHQEILTRLIGSNKINAEPEKKAIAKELARKDQPIVVYTRIWTTHLENWQDKRRTFVDGFIDFWVDWPKIYTQRHLFLVFLSFHYESA